MNCTLTRKRKTNEYVFGFLQGDKGFSCWTLERPWLDNAKEKSCIPEGKYICRRTNSPTFGVCFEVINVPNRSAILIHSGNFAHDSRGCIILGEYEGILNGEFAVLNSRNTIKRFLKAQKDIEQFMLEIKSE